MKAIFMAAIMASIALAGCTSDDEGPSDQVVDSLVSEENFVLQAGKGAIAGLLVDDRFRPIHLTDDPETEFQTSGFVLLQELGLQAKTNENGEFSFVDLEPGTYTIRVTAEGHEGVPSKIQVEEGLFAEASILMRRVSSEGGFIVTEEYTGFAACGISVGVTTLISNCFDTSGESDRRGTNIDFTALGDNATYMVVEVRVDNPGWWLIQISHPSRSPQYGNVEFKDDVYGKRIYENGGLYNDQNPNPWDNTNETRSLMFYGGDIANPTPDNVCTPAVITLCPGTFDFGAAIGHRVRMMFSAFVGEPEVDLETYEILTADGS